MTNIPANKIETVFEEKFTAKSGKQKPEYYYTATGEKVKDVLFSKIGGSAPLEQAGQTITNTQTDEEALGGEHEGVALASGAVLAAALQSGIGRRGGRRGLLDARQVRHGIGAGRAEGRGLTGAAYRVDGRLAAMPRSATHGSWCERTAGALLVSVARAGAVARLGVGADPAWACVRVCVRGRGRRRGPVSV